MEYICSYFDTQGFYIGNSFHPVEAVMYGDSFLVQTRVAKTCDCHPSSSERNQMRYLKENHHGLEINREGVPLTDLKELMKAFYKGVKNNKKFLVGVRSREAETFLDKLNIPVLNINLLYGATFNAITSGHKPCMFHKNQSTTIKCSLNIVQDMEQYIKNKKLSSNL